MNKDPDLVVRARALAERVASRRESFPEGVTHTALLDLLREQSGLLLELATAVAARAVPPLPAPAPTAGEPAASPNARPTDTAPCTVCAQRAAYVCRCGRCTNLKREQPYAACQEHRALVASMHQSKTRRFFVMRGTP